MTDPIVAVEPVQLQAEPGGQALTVLTVRNQGQIVDGFRLTVLGAGPPAWARVEPAELRILPGEEGSATVIFSPPAGSKSVSGNYPFGILVSSTVDPTTSAAVEGDLKVGSIQQLQSRLSPVSSTGRWRSRHIFEVTNWGNAPVRLRVAASDQDNQLGFLLVPATLDVPIGGTGVSQLQVRTRHPRLRGAITRLPFQVRAAPEDTDPQAPPSPLGTPGTATVDGAFSQRPILSKLVVGLLALVLVAGAGTIALALRSKPAASVVQNASGAPNTPDLTVTAVDSESLKLKWSAQPNLKSYSLVEVTPDGAFLRPTALDPVQTEAIVDGLQPSSTHCYRLQAVRGDLSSVYSEAKCATTQSAPVTTSPSTPGSPATTTGASTAPSSATKTSTAVSSTATSSPPSSRPGGGAGGVALPGGPVVVPGSVFGPTAASTAKPGTPTLTPTSTPSTSVVSTSSPTSSPTVSPTVSSTGPTSAQPEGVFTPTQYIAVYGMVFLPPNPANTVLAREVAATLPAGTMKPGVVDTSKYSQFAVGATAVATPTLYIYVGPFNTSADAQTFCEQHVSDWFQGCLVAHPGALAGN